MIVIEKNICKKFEKDEEKMSEDHQKYLHTVADYSQITPSYIYDRQHKKRIFNKSIFFLFLKISLSVSAFMSFLYFFSGDLIGLITFAITGFFGTFGVLIVIFYIERLYNVILNKRNRKNQKIEKESIKNE